MSTMKKALIATLLFFAVAYAYDALSGRQQSEARLEEQRARALAPMIRDHPNEYLDRLEWHRKFPDDPYPADTH
jgi:hypothetical protein